MSDDGHLATMRLWQLIDSVFPTGGFAHSGGLEGALQGGWVHDPASCTAWLQEALVNLAHQQLPLLNAVVAAPDDWPVVDARCTALLREPAAARASTQQGQALLSAVVKTTGDERLRRLRADVLRGEAACHQIVVWGLIAAPLDLDAAAVRQAALFCALRDMVSSAVRLGVLGPYAAQRLQWQLAPLAQRLADAASDDTPAAACCTNPLLELFQGQHDRLHSRLFHS